MLIARFSVLLGLVLTLTSLGAAPGNAKPNDSMISYTPLTSGPPYVVGKFPGLWSGLNIVIPPLGKAGFATDEKVRAQFGEPKFEFENCGDDISRTIVRVKPSKPKALALETVNQLTRRAILEAWHRCASVTHGNRGEALNLNLGGVDIYWPRTTVIFSFRQLKGDAYTINGTQQFIYVWQSAIDFGFQQSPVSDAATPPERQSKGMGRLIFGLVIVFVLGLLVHHYETVGQFICAVIRYYYSLTPHPVSTLVDRAVARGEHVEIDDWKKSLSPRPRNRFERAAREAQMREAHNRLRAHQHILRAEEERRLRLEQQIAKRNADAARLYDVSEAETVLLQAIFDHQTDAARVDAIRTRQKRS